LEKEPRRWVVYLLRCSDGSLYCGVSNDVGKRLEAHNAGKGAKYTRSRTPVALVCTSPEMTKSDAHKLEYRVKQAPAQRKEEMIRRDGQPGKPIRSKEEGIDPT
jgi:putative endonuclease